MALSGEPLLHFKLGRRLIVHCVLFALTEYPSAILGVINGSGGKLTENRKSYSSVGMCEFEDGLSGFSAAIGGVATSPIEKDVGAEDAASARFATAFGIAASENSSRMTSMITGIVL